MPSLYGKGKGGAKEKASTAKLVDEAEEALDAPEEDESENLPLDDPFSDDDFEEEDDESDEDEDGDDDESEESGDDEPAPWARNGAIPPPAGKKSRPQTDDAEGDAPESEPKAAPRGKADVLSRHDRASWNKQFYDIIALDGDNKGQKWRIYRHRTRRELVTELWKICGQVEGNYEVFEFTPKKLTSNKPSNHRQTDTYFVELPTELPDENPNAPLYQAEPDYSPEAQQYAPEPYMPYPDDDSPYGEPEYTPVASVTQQMPMDIVAAIRANTDAMLSVIERTRPVEQQRPAALTSIEYIERIAGIAGTLAPVLTGMFGKRESTTETVSALLQLAKDREQPQMFEMIMPVIPMVMVGVMAKMLGGATGSGGMSEEAIKKMMESTMKTMLPAPQAEEKGLPTPKGQHTPTAAAEPAKEATPEDSKYRPISVYETFEDFVVDTLYNVGSKRVYFGLSGASRILESGNQALVKKILDTPTDKLEQEFIAVGQGFSGLNSWLQDTQTVLLQLTSQSDASTDSEPPSESTENP